MNFRPRLVVFSLLLLTTVCFSSVEAQLFRRAQANRNCCQQQNWTQSQQNQQVYSVAQTSFQTTAIQPTSLQSPQVQSVAFPLAIQPTQPISYQYPSGSQAWQTSVPTQLQYVQPQTVFQPEILSSNVPTFASAQAFEQAPTVVYPTQPQANYAPVDNSVVQPGNIPGLETVITPIQGSDLNSVIQAPMEIAPNAAVPQPSNDAASVIDPSSASPLPNQPTIREYITLPPVQADAVAPAEPASPEIDNNN